jgi:D-serine deaminase-like pyridoxal phosphate-dependent protein
VAKVREVKELLREHKLPVKTVTGGGTGTYLLEAASGEYTEVQPGSYVFNDEDYAANQGPTEGPLLLTHAEWEQSLFVAATVMSRTDNKVRASTCMCCSSNTVDNLHALRASFVQVTNQPTDRQSTDFDQSTCP